MADIQECRGGRHLRVHGKGDKIRYEPLHPGAASAIAAYLKPADLGTDGNSALFALSVTMSEAVLRL